MPRVRANDYDVKSQSILDNAAALFSKVGYPKAKMQDIAQACGVTKSMLYHYFPTKDDLLLELLTEHLDALISDVESSVEALGSPEDRFTAFVQVYVQKSTRSRQRHLSAMNDAKFLPEDMQPAVRTLQAKVVDLATLVLRDMKPALPDHLYKPYALLLLGALNWTELWYRPDGPISPDELCERIVRLFLNGFMAEAA
ncbi:TetR/AcrR family transcriptional regulator [Azospirillum sp. INR13]|uniref:TetR/AcrR family transcriptional regulator n=1 Tax=Azospirillum sp. INR13 TaxID=2596919 RepID=UPI0018920854|nr:TetR/AcrR family transcriptional regulator [Azospirillum sp. INR13]MBF5096504.1 TetR/AcrR family transcriptional regulator [Azospirillum sp. INR13]